MEPDDGGTPVTTPLASPESMAPLTSHLVLPALPPALPQVEAAPAPAAAAGGDVEAAPAPAAAAGGDVEDTNPGMSDSDKAEAGTAAELFLLKALDQMMVAKDVQSNVLLPAVHMTPGHGLTNSAPAPGSVPKSPAHRRRRSVDTSDGGSSPPHAGAFGKLRAMGSTPYRLLFGRHSRARVGVSMDTNDASTGSSLMGDLDGNTSDPSIDRRTSIVRRRSRVGASRDGPALFSGFLRKAKDSKLGMYKLKYVEVRPGVMLYSTDPVDIDNPKRSSRIEFDSRTYDCVTVDTDKWFGQKEWVFSVRNTAQRGSRRLWKASSEEERQAWMDAVEQSVLAFVSQDLHRHIWYCNRVMQEVRGSRTEAEYRGVMRGCLREGGIQIPIAWANEQLSLSRGGFKSDFEQVLKDVKREQVVIDGILYNGGDVGAAHIVFALAASVLKVGQATNRLQQEAEAFEFARELLLKCNRTAFGGDTYGYLDMLFGKPSFSLLCPLAAEEQPLSFTVSSTEHPAAEPPSAARTLELDLEAAEGVADPLTWTPGAAPHASTFAEDVPQPPPSGGGHRRGFSADTSSSVENVFQGVGAGAGMTAATQQPSPPSPDHMPSPSGSPSPSGRGSARKQRTGVFVRFCGTSTYRVMGSDPTDDPDASIAFLTATMTRTFSFVGGVCTQHGDGVVTVEGKLSSSAHHTSPTHSTEPPVAIVSPGPLEVCPVEPPAVPPLDMEPEPSPSSDDDVSSDDDMAGIHDFTAALPAAPPVLQTPVRPPSVPKLGTTSANPSPVIPVVLSPPPSPPPVPPHARPPTMSPAVSPAPSPVPRVASPASSPEPEAVGNHARSQSEAKPAMRVITRQRVPPKDGSKLRPTRSVGSMVGTEAPKSTGKPKGSRGKRRSAVPSQVTAAAKRFDSLSLAGGGPRSGRGQPRSIHIGSRHYAPSQAQGPASAPSSPRAGSSSRKNRKPGSRLAARRPAPAAPPPDGSPPSSSPPSKTSKSKDVVVL